MANLDEIEEFYKKEVSKQDKIFLENIFKNSDETKRSELEKKYKENLKKLKEEYEKRIADYLKDQRKVINTKKIKEEKKEVFKSFEVKKLDLELNWKSRFKIKYELLKFRNNIKLKNFSEKYIPEFLKIFLLKFKIMFKNFLAAAVIKFSQIYLSIKKNLIKLGIRLKENLSLILEKSYSLIKKLFSQIFSVFSKFSKKEGKKEEKRPDEEIAERLIEKSKKS